MLLIHRGLTQLAMLHFPSTQWSKMLLQLMLRARIRDYTGRDLEQLPIYLAAPTRGRQQLNWFQSALHHAFYQGRGTFKLMVVTLPNKKAKARANAHPAPVWLWLMLFSLTLLLEALNWSHHHLVVASVQSFDVEWKKQAIVTLQKYTLIQIVDESAVSHLYSFEVCHEISHLLDGVLGDGHCGFRALSNHAALRASLVAFIRSSCAGRRRPWRVPNQLYPTIGAYILDNYR